MSYVAERPRVVLICHADDRIDIEALPAWLAHEFQLAGVVTVREGWKRMLRRIRAEYRRVGPLRFLDVLAFRLYYRLALAEADEAWKAEAVRRIRARYPARLDGVATLATRDPNAPEVATFLHRQAPDFVIARCKSLLRDELLGIPRAGIYVLHPGICPEYRNAHGCFWALVNRDLGRVGMTLLRADRGVDTGPILLQASYAFDERKESPIVVEYRVVLENLQEIADALRGAVGGRARLKHMRVPGTRLWGQPWLSAYLRWRRAANGAAP